MMHSPKRLLGYLVLAGTVWISTSANAADAKVGVIDTIQASLSLRLNARQAVATALDELGVAMVPMEDLTTEDAACTESACFLSVAKRVGATHLILVSGVANPAGYRLSLDVRDGASGRSLGTDGKDCELCAEDQFGTTLQERVTSLWKRVAREEDRAQAATRKRRLQPVVADGEEHRAESMASSSSWARPLPIIGLGLGAAGLVGIGFGAYYVAVDGKAVEYSHPDLAQNSHAILVRDTGKWGWMFLGLGAASLIGGTAMVIWGRDDGGAHGEVSAVVGPGSLGLQGKF